MISLALAATFCLANAQPLQATRQTVVLARGGVAAGVPIWDVEDTTLNSGNPNKNFGSDFSLSGGKGKTILIRFGDLDRVVRPGQKIRHATLVFTDDSGSSPKSTIRGISRILVPWGEGPYASISGIFSLRPKVDPSKQGQKPDEPAAPLGSATWRQRRAGMDGGGWSEPGGAGTADAVPIDSAHLATVDPETRIQGLEEAVQTMVDHPLENFGFAVCLDGTTDFSSSKSDRNRPRLELELEDVPVTQGPDLSVISIQRLGSDGRLPAMGTNATFTAHVKNVGDAPAKPFSTTWTVDERTGTAAAVNQPLDPGQETTVTYQTQVHGDKTDHRFHTVRLQIRPDGNDASSRNNDLTVFSDGKPIEVVVPKDVAAKLASGLNSLGSRSPEDWVQAQARTFNDVYLAQSRFSFAPEGARERVAVQRVVIGDAPASSDGSARLVLAAPSDLASIDVAFIKALATTLGLSDRSASNVPAERNELTGRGSLDRFPGVMGYGDTRYEGLAPGEIELPYEPIISPVFDTTQMEATGLLCETDVATLNAALGSPPVELPHAILVRAIGQSGNPIANTELAFFQTQNGVIPKGATPTFTATTDAKGTAFLPKRDGGPFGVIDSNFGNADFFVRATANGVTDGAWLKAWQAMDSATRGNQASRAVAIMDLHLSLPTDPLDSATNLATDRIVTDPTGSLPAKLAALIDGSNDTETVLSAKPGDWIEIDLGRDRTVGEIDIVAEPGAMWKKFDLMAYSTGQRPEEAVFWSREADWTWTSQNRRDVLGPTRVLVPYRGSALQFRYLRLVNRSGGPGKLAEIKIIPAKVASPH